MCEAENANRCARQDAAKNGNLVLCRAIVATGSTYSTVTYTVQYNNSSDTSLPVSRTPHLQYQNGRQHTNALLLVSAHGEPPSTHAFFYHIYTGRMPAFTEVVVTPLSGGKR